MLVQIFCLGRVNRIHRHVSILVRRLVVAVPGGVLQRRWSVFAGHHELALQVVSVKELFQRRDKTPSRLQISEPEAELNDVDHVALVQHVVA